MMDRVQEMDTSFEVNETYCCSRTAPCNWKSAVKKKISDLDYVKDKFAAKQKQINMLQNWI